jgi:hypothetical protein
MGLAGQLPADLVGEGLSPPPEDVHDLRLTLGEDFREGSRHGVFLLKV